MCLQAASSVLVFWQVHLEAPEIDPVEKPR
jgi:hypothetical protein